MTIRRHTGRTYPAAYPMPCETGKIPFLSKHEAHRYIDTHRKYPSFTARHAYRCPHCQQWHMTSQRRET